MKWIKKIGRFGLIGVILVLGISFVLNRIVIKTTDRYNYTDINKIPAQKVGMVLGTSKYTRFSGTNLFYQYRVDAAVKLFEAGKIEYILISGDNGTMEYNEPQTFKEDLIAQGIPEDKIILDYAGFRTYDSVIRAKKVFGLDKVTIISQEFHNQRALYIARRSGITAYAFAAQNVGESYGRKTMIREYFAKVKAYLDVLFNKDPKFLGEKIEIG